MGSDTFAMTGGGTIVYLCGENNLVSCLTPLTKFHSKSDVVVHNFIPSIQEVEAG